jgi:hypothetical protein
MKPYILDDASAFEYQRLDLMSKILDPWTRGYLTTLGVAEGWHCLELGGGNGSIAEWLAAEVGAPGSVRRSISNPVLLDLLPAQNLSVQQMDVRSGDSSVASCPAWGPLGVSDIRRRKPTCRTSVAGIAERCISSCSSPRCATASSGLGSSTPQRSTPHRPSWRTRTIGRSAG